MTITKPQGEQILITELIASLQSALEQHGDIGVHVDYLLPAKPGNDFRGTASFPCRRAGVNGADPRFTIAAFCIK